MEGPQKLNNRPERRVVSDAEKIRSYLKVEQIKLAKEFAEKQKDIPAEEQIRISPDFRIEPPPKRYPEGQKNLVDEYLRKHHGSSDPTEVVKNENERSGFMFEILKTAIMHKRIGERFIVVRSSHYDDIVNRIDNVLVDRKIGHTVCALDEVSPRSMQEEVIKNKRVKMREINFGSAEKTEVGVTLEYGINLKEGKISCGKLGHLPIFLLSLDQKHLNEGLSHFQYEKKISQYEDNLFKYFLKSLASQIQGLKLIPQEYGKLPADMRTRIESLTSFLQEQGEKL